MGVKVIVRFSDGHYTLHEAGEYIPFVEISEREWELYKAHRETCGCWHQRLRDISNELFAKEERIKLLPEQFEEDAGC